MTDQDKRNLERETRILDAAGALIVRYGFAKTTMDDIAAEAAVSKGALYLHFRSKDDLFEALILRESEAISERLLDAVLADPQGGSIMKVYTLGLNAIAGNPLMRALYTRDQRVLGDYLRRLRASSSYSAGFDFGQAYVEQMQAAGLLRRDLEAGVIAYILAALRHGLLTLNDAVDSAQLPSLERVTPVIGEMLENTLAPQGGDQEAGKAAFRALLEFGRRVIAERRAARQRT
mgnify:CR=1 FL=1|jgi:AcrR family transcriptional regulator